MFISFRPELGSLAKDAHQGQSIFATLRKGFPLRDGVSQDANAFNLQLNHIAMIQPGALIFGQFVETTRAHRA